MTQPMIRAENLGKRYRIGLAKNRPTSFHEALFSALSSPFRYWRETARRATEAETVWALKDASFEIGRGEVVGIIGRNGAGKTTLLKVLARITEPTEGQAVVEGRIGSLLEVGTGFHPDLTGRENIFLSGAILGMKKKEIERKFDEIVAFAEIRKFLDTPVKRYSSGMYVRLAFAVAAHFEPEVLLVDEVLAVGDLDFQKRCIGKMGSVAEGGRTVLFVSHQMNTIRRLCGRSIWLDQGRIQMADSTAKVLSAYETKMSSLAPDSVQGDGKDSGAAARFLRWEILEPRSEQPNWVTTLGPVKFKIEVQLRRPVVNGHSGISLRNSDNQLLWGWAADNLRLKAGVAEFTYTLPGLPLKPGIYYLHVSLYDDLKFLDEWNCAPELVIATEPVAHRRDEWAGILNIPCGFEAIER